MSRPWIAEAIELFADESEHINNSPRPHTPGASYRPAPQSGAPAAQPSGAPAAHPSEGITGSAERTVSECGSAGVLDDKFSVGHECTG